MFYYKAFACILQTIRSLLAELDTLAKLAERRKRWSVCVAIDGDINKVYTLLRNLGYLQGAIIDHPGRKRGMWRIARCYLELV
jgi:hypothetical protein